MPKQREKKEYLITRIIVEKIYCEGYNKADAIEHAQENTDIEDWSRCVTSVTATPQKQ